MGADRDIQLRVHCAKDLRHGCASGHAGNEHSPLVNAIGRRNLPCDAGDERRLSRIPNLTFGPEPVPTPRSVRIGVLGGIDHEEAVLVGQRIHLGAGREILRGLRSTMQHHDRRNQVTRFRCIAGGNVKPVIARSCIVCERSVQECTGEGVIDARSGAGTNAVDVADRRVDLPGGLIEDHAAFLDVTECWVKPAADKA